jgi:hypothetical protein
LATWTRAALSSEARPIAGRCWRVVEAQHVVSTMKLVDTLVEQELLERLLEESKPALPVDCRHLHYLLSTPFRYGAPYPRGSRFRRPGLTPGVFYASVTVETAIAEMVFHRLLFFAESPTTPWPVNAGEFTAFAVRVRTKVGLDLTAPRFEPSAARWRHPVEYRHCQTLAEQARSAGVEILRYHSARDPGGGRNIAVLTCRAFAAPEPIDRQTWRVHFGPSGARAIGDGVSRRLGFPRTAFASDPRIVALEWER